MKFAIVENGKVTNIVLAEPEFAAQQSWINVDGAAVEIGYLYVDNEFMPNTAEITAATAAAARAKRDQLLADSDWVVIKALENSQGLDFDWAAYRQALRDIPQQAGFPETVVWPVKP